MAHYAKAAQFMKPIVKHTLTAVAGYEIGKSFESNNIVSIATIKPQINESEKLEVNFITFKDLTYIGFVLIIALVFAYIFRTLRERKPNAEQLVLRDI